MYRNYNIICIEYSVKKNQNCKSLIKICNHTYPIFTISNLISKYLETFSNLDFINIDKMSLNDNHQEILQKFMNMIPQIDFNSAVKVLNKSNWDLEAALSKYFESANMPILSKISKPVSSIANSFFSGISSLVSAVSNEPSSEKSQNPRYSAPKKSSFEDFIESSSLPNFPVIYPMEESAINSFVFIPKKKGLVYLHTRSKGSNFLRQVLCDSRVVTIIENNFVFFADFQDSDQAISIKNQFLNGINFVFAVFSHDGILGLLEVCEGINQTIEFLISKSQDDAENLEGSQKYKFDAGINQEIWNKPEFDYGLEGFNGNFGIQEHGDEELMRAIEESKRLDQIRHQNINQRKAEEDELQLAIELSKFSQQEEVKINLLQNPHHPSQIYNHIQSNPIKKVDSHINSDRIIRKQQDLEMESAERMYKEELKRKEEEEKASQEKIRNKNKDLEEKLKILGEEPEQSQDSCMIRFFLPAGERLQRRFLLKAGFQILYCFIETKGLENFDIMTGFPGIVISSGTLESNGFANGGICHVKIRV